MTDGEHEIIPGCAPLSDREVAERRMEGRRRARKPQRPVEDMAGGLWSGDDRQMSLLD